MRATDRDLAQAILERQRQALGEDSRSALAPAVEAIPDVDSAAYRYVPSATRVGDVPEEFDPVNAPPASTSAPTSTTSPATMPASSQPTRLRAETFSLRDALRYAERHRREYQTAKEDLYLIALALTLERHLWTPIFAADLRTVYGNFGEITDFDQAMRFMAEVSASQRLPYGGEFTAKAISTLIRDVKRNATAVEGSQVQLGLNIPFLRNAGHIAREELIQLERDLTYAVRDFERFRRRQLVEVAQGYFDLLRTKQDVLDAIESFERFQQDFERAAAQEALGLGTLLDTARAEQEMLSAANRVEDLRETFRLQTDNFKLQIGMPVDEPLGMDDLEDIEAIEQQVAAKTLPLLLMPAAAYDEARATEVARERRLDLVNRLDQIDDARRGVAVAKNQLLPNLDWTSTLTFDTDPEHYQLGAFSVDRATWRTELLLSLPLERFRERNELRAAIIDVDRARRAYEELVDRIRAEVRAAVNRLRLEERSLEIQARNLEVSDKRRTFARIQFEEGEISNRDVVEAENDWSTARSRLNLAKTARWNALLNFRLATETLIIDETDVAATPGHRGMDG